MTKEEFENDYSDFNNKIINLQSQLTELKKAQRQLREEYIEQFREFQNGDLVNVTHGGKQRTEKAFISSAGESSGKITYTFLQVKKDGKPSSRQLYVDFYNWSPEVKIELLNTEYRNKNWDGSPIAELNKPTT